MMFVGFSRSGSRILHGSKFCFTAKMHTKVVIFDMGGVMITAPKHAWTKFEEKHGLSSGSILQTMLHPSMVGDFIELEKGHIAIDVFEPKFSEFYWKQQGKSGQGVLPILSEFGNYAAVHECMNEAVECLKAEGITTALLTNNFWYDSAKTRSLLWTQPGLFHHIFQSCELGMRKPDREIYEYVLDKLKVKAENAVFLDDLGNNLRTAQEMGMKTIKVDDPQIAVQELETVVGFALKGYVNGTSKVRTALDTQRLQEYLSSKFGQSSDINVRQFRHGQSNPTYFVGFGDKKLVLRKKPPGKLLASAHQVEREFEVMNAVANFSVPVPPLVELCTNSEIVGTEFYLMEYVDGRIFQNPQLPGMTAADRKHIYAAACQTLANIHSVPLKEAGLETFGKKGGYLERQIARWSKQYEASKTHQIEAMQKLLQWLPKNIPSAKNDTLVHGDYRLDNLIFCKNGAEVLGVLDWELATLGDPITDLATVCMVYYLPSTFPLLKGLADIKDLSSLGIPTEEEFIREYCRLSGITVKPEEWPFYVAFICFRFAAILQGVYKRSLQGQASAANADKAGMLAEYFAQLACKQTKKMGGGDEKLGLLPSTPSSLSPKTRKIFDSVREFVQTEVIGREQDWLQYAMSDQMWIPNPQLEWLKEKAKSMGLWNLFIPAHLDPERKYGACLTNVEYAHICEQMGYSLFAPEVFNCSAPDTGNMEVLLKYGNEEQKKKWLIPLIEGNIRSCFAMTEPEVASSDATNIRSSIKKDGDSYVINGRKWYISGAMDPRTKICIFMGKTDEHAMLHKQQSMVLVPMDTLGITVQRPLGVLGYLDAPSGHAEILFENVRVPAANLILGEGRGFEIAQGRLGPGRIHHCMRLIGHSERALQIMIDRVQYRVAFGRPLVEQGTIRRDIALSRLEIEQARLLVLKTAHAIDEKGNKAAAMEISMIKAAVPSMAMKVIDRAIQSLGAKGLSQDTVLPTMYAWARALRFADGPDEVHLESIAKREIKSKM